MAASEGMTPLQQAEKIRALKDHVGLDDDQIREKFPELADGWGHLTEVALSSPDPAGAGPVRLDVGVVPLRV